MSLEQKTVYLQPQLPELTEQYYAKYLTDYTRVAEMVKKDPGVAYLIHKHTPDSLGQAWLTMLVERDRMNSLHLLPLETRETLLAVGVALAAVWAYKPVYNPDLFGTRSRPPLTPATYLLVDQMWSILSYWAGPAITANHSDNYLAGEVIKSIDEYRVKKLTMFQIDKRLEDHDLGLYLARKVCTRFLGQDYVVPGLNPTVKDVA